MSYHLELTETEERELQTMANAGYDCGLWDLLGSDAVRLEYVLCTGKRTYEIPEYLVCALKQRYETDVEFGNDPFGPFTAATIRAKVEQLLASVV